MNATSFLLTVTALHEYVHYGTNANGVEEGKYDFGTGFEQTSFGVTIDGDNAGAKVIQFKEYF